MTTGLVRETKRRGDIEGRFWAKVDRGEPADCWLWTGALNRGGYGVVSVAGRLWRAHRYAYEVLVGPIAPALTLDHLCRIRACVNPSHLEAVTQQENVRRGFEARGGRAARPAKTRCPRGHEYVAYGHCRPCSAAASRRYRQKRRAA